MEWLIRSGGTVEYEQAYDYVSGKQPVVDKLVSLGAKFVKTVNDMDVYYGVPGETMDSLQAQSRPYQRIRVRDGEVKVAFKNPVSGGKDEREETVPSLEEAKKMMGDLKPFHETLATREIYILGDAEIDFREFIKPARKPYMEIESVSGNSATINDLASKLSLLIKPKQSWGL